MYECMYVCVCVGMYVCVYLCICMQILKGITKDEILSLYDRYACMNVFVYVCVNVCLCVCMYVCMYGYVCNY